MTLEIITCEQGTDEWLKARAGLITASSIQHVMAEPKKGESVSKTRDQYMRQLAAERITGEPCIIFEGNGSTERGKKMEPKARELYELQTGNEVHEVGFIRDEEKLWGISPDALIGEDGGAEIKSKRADIMVSVLLSQRTPAEHIKQIQFSLLVTGRQWWDFVAYCPKMPLYVKRHYPDRAMQMEMKQAIHFFKLDLDAMLVKLADL